MKQVCYLKNVHKMFLKKIKEIYSMFIFEYCACFLLFLFFLSEQGCGLSTLFWKSNHFYL